MTHKGKHKLHDLIRTNDIIRGKNERLSNTVHTFLGHCVRMNPVTQRNPGFTQQRAVRDQRLNKDSTKLKLNIRIYVWTSKEKTLRHKESEE